MDRNNADLKHRALLMYFAFAVTLYQWREGEIESAEDFYILYQENLGELIAADKILAAGG